MKTKYIAAETAPLLLSSGDEIQLLWGDRVRIDETDKNGIKNKCQGRGYEGYIEPNPLGAESLLEDPCH